MAKVTVIVPIYNVEQYVRTCLDSLIKQTYTDFEVWAINDGSPANEQEIVEEYAKKYPFIKAIKKENGGYGSVLQYAISNLKSDFFLVCDPDDYLADNALEVLVSQAEVSQADLTIGAKYFIYSDSDGQQYDASYNTEYVTLSEEKVYKHGTEEFNDLFFVDPSPHAKLYKKKVAEKIVFPTKVGYTDNLLFYISLLSSDKVSYCSKACAYYLIDRQGNTSTDLKPRVLEQHVVVFTTILNQSKTLSAVPAIFYYRMFESFKFIFYTSRRIEATKEVLTNELMNLYRVVELLVPYKKEIMSYYKKYTKNRSIEQIKDKLLLNPTTSKWMYKRWVEQLVGER